MSTSPNGSTFRLGILETGRNRPALEEKFGTFAQSFHRYLGATGESIQFADFPVWQGQLPTDPQECDAWLVTGSAASVYDDEYWIAPLEAFVRDAAGMRPVVGICFGHQLIAQAFGGKVERSDRGWGIGVHHYDVVETTDWMDPALDRLSLVVSHQDQVTAPPPGARVLASSAFCPVAMMQVGDRVLTIQAHPEAPSDYAAAIYGLRRDVIGPETVDAAIASLDGEVHDRHVGKWLMRFMAGGG